MKKFLKIFLLVDIIFAITIGTNFLYKYYKINKLPPYYKEIYNNSDKRSCDYVYIQYMNKNNIITIYSNDGIKYNCPEKYIKTYIPKLLCSDGITIEMENWCKLE